MKLCNRCGSNPRNEGDGWCRDCRKVYNREYARKRRTELLWDATDALQGIPADYMRDWIGEHPRVAARLIYSYKTQTC